MTKHRMAKTPEYWAWQHAKRRCNDPKDRMYSEYGGRGIKVCAQWENDFLAFLAEVGPRPSPEHSLDRMKNELGYEPGNCRWATKQEQSANRRYCHRLQWQGREVTLAELARLTGRPHMSIKYRLQKGMTVEQAVQPEKTLARTNSRFVTFNGETLAVPEWAARIGVRVRTLRERLRRGMPLERALAP